MVGKLLGHSKIQSTMRYVHLDDNSVRLAAEQVSDGLAGAINWTTGAIAPGLRVVK